MNNKKTVFVASVDALSIPADGICYGSLEELRRNIRTDADLNPDDDIFYAEVVVGPIHKLIVKTKLVETEVTASDLGEE